MTVLENVLSWGSYGSSYHQWDVQAKPLNDENLPVIVIIIIMTEDEVIKYAMYTTVYT